MRGVWFVLKIHIVRKGDTLWEIAKQYGVDFEELKAFNPQLSSPDMIMPGMKIRIPSATKSVKKETAPVKESKLPIAKETPKQSPIIQEDDHEKPKEVKIEMPKEHTPKPQAEKKEIPNTKESPKTPVKPIKETPKAPVKPMKEMIKMPIIEEDFSITLPETSKPKEHKKEKDVHQMPVAPIYHHYYHHCCVPPYHPCFPVMGEMAGGFMPQEQMHHMHQMQMQHMPQSQQMMQPHDCGCHKTMPQMQQYQMREQAPEPLQVGNIEPFGYQPYMTEPQYQPTFQGSPSLQPQFTNGLNATVESPFPMPPTYPPVSEFNNQENRQEERRNEDESENK